MLILVVLFISRIPSTGMNQTTNSIHRCVTKMSKIMLTIFLQVIGTFGEVYLVGFISIFRVATSTVCNIEIINNTRGGIEGKIGERDDWGANSSPGCSLIHDVPDKKSRFRRVFPLFKLFFVVRIFSLGPV